MHFPMYPGSPVYFPFYIVLSGTEQYDVIIEYRFYATERDKKKIPFRNETGKQKTLIVEAYQFALAPKFVRSPVVYVIALCHMGKSSKKVSRII